MLDVKTLREIFTDKLRKEDSLDAAFTKAVWVAYKRGLADGQQERKQHGTSNTDDSVANR